MVKWIGSVSLCVICVAVVFVSGGRNTAAQSDKRREHYADSVDEGSAQIAALRGLLLRELESIATRVGVLRERLEELDRHERRALAARRGPEEEGGGARSRRASGEVFEDERSAPRIRGGDRERSRERDDEVARRERRTRLQDEDRHAVLLKRQNKLLEGWRRLRDEDDPETLPTRHRVVQALRDLLAEELELRERDRQRRLRRLEEEVERLRGVLEHRADDGVRQRLVNERLQALLPDLQEPSGSPSSPSSPDSPGGRGAPERRAVDASPR